MGSATNCPNTLILLPLPQTKTPWLALSGFSWVVTGESPWSLFILAPEILFLQLSPLLIVLPCETERKFWNICEIQAMTTLGCFPKPPWLDFRQMVGVSSCKLHLACPSTTIDLRIRLSTIWRKAKGSMPQCPMIPHFTADSPSFFLPSSLHWRSWVFH